MKKLLLILLCLPMIGFGQQNSNQMGNSTDAAINIVLENVFEYLSKDDFFTPNGEFNISTKKDSIDWDNTQFIKWKVIQPKDSLQIIKTID
jgi:hypothetical protein